MGVYIKGMEMPTCCDECAALDEYGDYPVCRITQEQRGYTFRTREKRMDKCPLVEVPPHGRLIDADALYAAMKKEHDRIFKDYGDDAFARCLTTYAMSMALSAPTIIEAEGE